MSKKKIRNKMPKCTQCSASLNFVGNEEYGDNGYKPEFGISDSRFSCYARFPIGAYYICPPNNMDGKMQNCKV